jgi:hypothetical protein
MAMAVSKASSVGAGLGVALEQDLAADAMQFCFERAVAGAVARRQRFIEDCNGAVWIARPGLRLGQRNLEQSVELEDVLFAQEIDAATHVLEPATWRAVRSGRPTLEKRGKRSKHG